MKSEISLKDVCLDFPIYDTESLSLRNRVSDMGKTIVTKSKKNHSKGKTISLAIGNHYKLLEFVKKENATNQQCALRKIWGS